MDKFLEKLETYILLGTIFLFPFIVLSISPNPFVVPKLAVLGLGISLLLLIKAVRIITSGRLNFAIGTFDFPVFLLGAATVASLILRTPNKMEGLLLPGTATAILVGVFLYFLINQHEDKVRRLTQTLLFTSGVVSAVLILMAFAGVLGKIPQLPAYIRATGFTPEGGYLPEAIFLATVIPLGVSVFLSSRDVSKKAFLGVSLIIVVIGLLVSVYNLLPGKPFTPRFPSVSASWSIAVDALKESPLLGVGPGNYLTAFNRFRPLSYNQTDLWAVRFATASNHLLTTLTELGMLGIAGMILILLVLYRTLREEIKKFAGKLRYSEIYHYLPLLILVILLAIFPATTTLTVVLFIYLSYVAKTKLTTLNLKAQGATDALNTQSVASRVPALLLALPVVVFVIFFWIRAYSVLLAEYKFNQALNFLIQNQANQTFDAMSEAIRLNPRVDRYHATFARVNLALANAIAQRATSQQATQGVEGQPAQISDQDRQNIALLVQQAIAEGKATVALNPLRAGNWEVLASIYRAIIPMAQGSDVFAIQTYAQAVALDPINPNLRINLGGVHYARGDFDNAIRAFEFAASAKPDHPNAHYNLAFALRDDGKLDRAIQEMTLVLSLIDRTTPDYEVARQALEDLQQRKAAQAPTGSELTPPQPAEEAVLEPPLELPEEAQPPEPPLSPTPTPEEAQVGEEEQGPFNLTPTP